MSLDPALAALLARLAADVAAVRPTDTDLAGARRSHERDALRFTRPSSATRSRTSASETAP
jgi:hypothetical protein